ncbi:putative F-box domain, galactose oxidase/kelch, beta-propeller, F-box associated interaction [Rosa chinensis]|uniref:Putative F-box domain, galactose oxidase/kelch, beta-propeller, F-box associated interaction n=1 Tax=Rosa chinensis TaxID=74649 RepID=A0A2P6S0Z6_ROSCH|nr:F-box/kelch-repeat protein At3g23880 [Rosa chinensis]PRQ52358.1 putative F-box domain, galactose oxidase/kelch, beta-propeller, F-box associated interaction [Rosa chinensis]
MSDALCSRRQKQVVLSGTAPSSESVDLDGVIVDILSRLPAKSLLRFRCVCKAWRALISDPYFIRKHLNCINTKISTSYSLLIRSEIFRSAEYEAILKCLSHDGPLPSRRLDFPVLDRLVCISKILIVGSCNGLICLILDFVTEESFTFMIWNPCTGEYQVLPQPPVHASRGCFFGFGYDSTSDDYKVIVGSSRYEFVVVFMLKKGSWRKLERLNRYFEVNWHGCLVNEALHWVLTQEEDGWLIAPRIVSFDLGEEKFHEIPFSYPPDANDRQGLFPDVGILCNCLTLEFQTMYGGVDSNISIWVMKDYGVKESWTEVLNIPPEDLDEGELYTCIACISENGEILMQLGVTGACPMALYNPREKTYRIVMHDHDTVDCTAPYIETLVSPLTGSTSACV